MFYYIRWIDLWSLYVVFCNAQCIVHAFFSLCNSGDLGNLVVTRLRYNADIKMHLLAPVSIRWMNSLWSFNVQHIQQLHSCKQITSQLFFINNIPTCNVCLLCQTSGEWTDAPRDKNAYSSLWFVQKLAVGGLRLRLGHGPGPELAHLPAAM